MSVPKDGEFYIRRANGGRLGGQRLGGNILIRYSKCFFSRKMGLMLQQESVPKDGDLVES